MLKICTWNRLICTIYVYGETWYSDTAWRFDLEFLYEFWLFCMPILFFHFWHFISNHPVYVCKITLFNRQSNKFCITKFGKVARQFHFSLTCDNLKHSILFDVSSSTAEKNALTIFVDKIIFSNFYWIFLIFRMYP